MFGFACPVTLYHMVLEDDMLIMYITTTRGLFVGVDSNSRSDANRGLTACLFCHYFASRGALLAEIVRQGIQEGTFREIFAPIVARLAGK